jgi:uncharacterized membrane protein YfcA
MATQISSLTWAAIRMPRLALDAVPTPLLFGIAGVAAGTWGWLLHATGATAALPAAFLMVGLAAALASIGGFAFSPICGALLLPFAATPLQSVQVILVCSIVNQVMCLWATRRAIDWRGLGPYLAGGTLGVPLGTLVLLQADAGLHPRLLGGLLVAHAGWLMLGRTVVLPRTGRLAAAAVGLLGGAMGGLAGFPSAPLTVWCGLQGWDKARQRGVYQPFILPMQVLALGLLAVLAPAPGEAGGSAAALLFVPASMAGTACGLAVFRRMTDRQFGRAVTGMLLAAGVAMLLR